MERREFLRNAVVAGGAVWAAPVIVTTAQPAQALYVRWTGCTSCAPYPEGGALGCGSTQQFTTPGPGVVPMDRCQCMRGLGGDCVCALRPASGVGSACSPERPCPDGYVCVEVTGLSSTQHMCFRRCYPVPLAG